jgi:hypothetical protein
MGIIEPIETLGAFIRAGITKSEDHLITVGRRLCEAHERIKSGKETISWRDFLAGHCGLKLSRAHELMRISGGSITIEQTRKRAREGMAAHRAQMKAKEDVRNVTHKPKATPLATALAAYDALYPADQTKFLEARGLQATPRPEAEPIPVTEPRSWRVEYIAKDGKRYGSAERLETEEDADLCRYYTRELDNRGIIVVQTRVFPSSDPPNATFKSFDSKTGKEKRGKRLYMMSDVPCNGARGCGLSCFSEIDANGYPTTRRWGMVVDPLFDHDQQAAA